MKKNGLLNPALLAELAALGHTEYLCIADCGLPIPQGVKTIDRMAIEMGMTREKALMLEHMILAHHYEPEFGSPKKPLFPEAEVLHYLDILDARMFDMQAALEATQPGDFSDRVWTLENRKLYKPVTI